MRTDFRVDFDDLLEAISEEDMPTIEEKVREMRRWFEEVDPYKNERGRNDSIYSEEKDMEWDDEDNWYEAEDTEEMEDDGYDVENNEDNWYENRNNIEDSDEDWFGEENEDDWYETENNIEDPDDNWFGEEIEDDWYDEKETVDLWNRMEDEKNDWREEIPQKVENIEEKCWQEDEDDIFGDELIAELLQDISIEKEESDYEKTEKLDKSETEWRKKSFSDTDNSWTKKKETEKIDFDDPELFVFLYLYYVEHESA